MTKKMTIIVGIMLVLALVMIAPVAATAPRSKEPNWQKLGYHDADACHDRCHIVGGPSASCNDCCNSQVCTAGSVCDTIPEACPNGFCRAPVCDDNDDCVDGNPCTTDTCDSAGICQHTNRALGTACGSSSNTGCDAPDTCDGAGTCVDRIDSLGTVCRPSAGVCDVAETCDGQLKTCPADAKSTAVCRAKDGACDVAESCNGVSNNCPPDAVASSSTTCRAAAGECDRAENCDGQNKICPSNVFKPLGSNCAVDNFCDGQGQCLDCLKNDDCGDAQTCEDGYCENLDCDDDNACTTDSIVNHACVHDQVSCDDGNPCNGAETCDVKTGCQPGTPIECPFGQECSPSSGQCVDACQMVQCAEGTTCHYGICVPSVCSDEMTAEPTANPTEGDAPLHVHFQANPTPDWDNGQTNRMQYEWSFGDGGNSQHANPNHMYTETGEFGSSVDITVDIKWQTRIKIGQHYEHRNNLWSPWHDVESCSPLGWKCRIVTDYSEWYDVCDQSFKSGPITVTGHDTPYVTGMKFADKDQDGVKDENEDGLDGYTITLYKKECGRFDDGPVFVQESITEGGDGCEPGCHWEQADQNITFNGGNYVFEGISTFGLFKVEETPKEGDTQTYPLDGHTHDYITKDGAYYFMVIGHETNKGFDFGNYNPRVEQRSGPTPFTQPIWSQLDGCPGVLRSDTPVDEEIEMPCGGATLILEASYQSTMDGLAIYTYGGGERSPSPNCDWIEYYNDRCSGHKTYGSGFVVAQAGTVDHGLIRVVAAKEESSTETFPAVLKLKDLIHGTVLWTYTMDMNTETFETVLKIKDDPACSCVPKPELMEVGWAKWHPQYLASDAGKGCVDSGGKVKLAFGCESTDAFPNTCLIGTLGCGPAHSKQVVVCDCGKDKCFDGTECVAA